MGISIVNINKTLGKSKILKDVSLEIQKGELISLLGPSGSGKTTLLRIIAGLETCDSGQVVFGDMDVTGIPAKDRKIGFVFQHYALFKNMTVFENVAFGMKIKPSDSRPSKSIIEQKVTQLLELVQLKNFIHRYPSQLSGGQRQRVALARALAVEPKILLLDEPFGALDAKVRKELRSWLKKLHSETKMTTIFVTHDQEEALEVSDRVVIMNSGKIEQIGNPEEVYSKPKTPFVYNFIGNVNIFHAREENGNLYIEPEAEIKEKGISASYIYVRPHDIDITTEKSSNEQIAGEVVAIYRAFHQVRVEVATEHHSLVLVEMTLDKFTRLSIKQGDKVYLSINEKGIFDQKEESDFVI